jgi:serine/threonine protein kinase
VRISANRLTKCPDQLLNLPKLAWFAFSGNPFSAVNEKINPNAIASAKSVPEISSTSYTLKQVLGQGASGVISQAVWNTPQSKFPDDIAVKVFKGEVTSDGYPQDELQACLQIGTHPNLVQSLAQVNEEDQLALVMNLIPSHYKNLGLPPCFNSCTRDTFPHGFTLSIKQISKIVSQITEVFENMHNKQVSHGDLYAHNTLFDDTMTDNNANIIFGDFGAASRYQMLTPAQQTKVKAVEQRALNYFIDDLLSVCAEEDKTSDEFIELSNTSNNSV